MPNVLIHLQYDLSATTYSPDGRVFQVEYADKAVENSGYGCYICECYLFKISIVVCSTAIGLRVKDGVVLAVEKLVLSKMLEPGTNRRVHTVDKHVGLVLSHLLHAPLV